MKTYNQIEAIKEQMVYERYQRKRFGELDNLSSSTDIKREIFQWLIKELKECSDD
tara:strand:- start:158 stop:322 length:165 start_codon:yes stop_codon:yes gene_type:complete